MLLVKRKDEECCETVPEEKPTVINPLPKIPCSSPSSKAKPWPVCPDKKLKQKQWSE